MLNFHFGRRQPTIKQWAAYSAGTAVAVSLIIWAGNSILSSRHGVLFKDTVCSVGKVLPGGDLSRLFRSLCRAVKDGTITPEEAKTALGRAQQATGRFSEYFDNDPENTDLRAKDEVDFAIEGWKRLSPSPKINQSLRRDFPSLTTAQLCVLSQAERYTDGDSIGIRYAGMSVCEEEE